MSKEVLYGMNKYIHINITFAVPSYFHLEFYAVCLQKEAMIVFALFGFSNKARSIP